MSRTFRSESPTTRTFYQYHLGFISQRSGVVRWIESRTYTMAHIRRIIAGCPCSDFVWRIVA